MMSPIVFISALRAPLGFKVDAETLAISYEENMGGVATVARSLSAPSVSSASSESGDSASGAASPTQERTLCVETFGYTGNHAIIPKGREIEVTERLKGQHVNSVDIPKSIYDAMYSGYSNGLLWPMMHIFINRENKKYQQLSSREKRGLAKKFQKSSPLEIEKRIALLIQKARTLMESNPIQSEELLEKASRLYLQYSRARSFNHKRRLRPLAELGMNPAPIQPLLGIFPIEQKREKIDVDWQAYEKANQIFVDKQIEKFSTLPETERKTVVFWINDYQLMLVPGLLRKALKELAEKLQEPDIANLRIAYFHHIPVPVTQAFNNIPAEHRKDILASLCSADQISFHVQEYVDNFLDVVEHNLQEVDIKKLALKTYATPIGIANEHFADNTTDQDGNPWFERFQEDTFINYKTNAKCEEKGLTEKEFNHLKELYEWKKDPTHLLINAADRIDPSKGLLERIRILDLLLLKNPDLVDKICFAMFVPNSRMDVEEYRNYNQKFKDAVKAFNKKYSEQTHGRDIIKLFEGDANRKSLRAAYHITDIHFASSKRDGYHLGPNESVMSLVNHHEKGDKKTVGMSLKEYHDALKKGTAPQEKTRPCLYVMSDEIGVAKTGFAKTALLYNPLDIQAGEEQLKKAITILQERPKEAIARTQALQLHSLNNDMLKWAEDNIFGLHDKLTKGLESALKDMILDRCSVIQALADGADIDPATIQLSPRIKERLEQIAKKAGTLEKSRLSPQQLLESDDEVIQCVEGEAQKLRPSPTLMMGSLGAGTLFHHPTPITPLVGSTGNHRCCF